MWRMWASLSRSWAQVLASSDLKSLCVCCKTLHIALRALALMDGLQIAQMTPDSRKTESVLSPVNKSMMRPQS